LRRPTSLNVQSHLHFQGRFLGRLISNYRSAAILSTDNEQTISFMSVN